MWARGSLVNECEGALSTHDDELIRGSEVVLELTQFFETAGSFWYISETVEFACAGSLNSVSPAIAFSDVLPFASTHSIVVFVTVSFHRHDGSRATNRIVVVDINDTPFFLVFYLHGPPPHSDVLFSFAASTLRTTDEMEGDDEPP